MATIMGLLCKCSSRGPWRRKKNCLLMVVPVMTIIAFMQMIEVNEVYSPMRPLSDAKGEARRLLKIMTHYNYECNLTSQVGNMSIWPICIDKGIGLDLESKKKKFLYTVGSSSDYQIERSLAANYSFNTYVVSPTSASYYTRGVNNTNVIKTAIVANDPADFSRNSYGQRTLNDLLTFQGHSHVDLLRLMSTVKNVEMWQLLDFLIKDGLLSKVDQLHLVVYIDKVEEEYLYNWYRTIYQLITKSRMYLYHTSSHDPLCLQVTLMDSCFYFLSFIRDPGPTVFLLYPPADYGTEEQEERRLFDYLNIPQVNCKQTSLASETIHSSFSSSDVSRMDMKSRWQICISSASLQKMCVFVRFSLKRDKSLEKKFIKDGCTVYTFVFTSTRSSSFRNIIFYKYSPVNKEKIYVSLDEVFRLLRSLPFINLFELDVVDEPWSDWQLLGEVLDSGVLQNVTQFVASVQISEKTFDFKVGGEDRPMVLRGYYSQMRRAESFGLALFYSNHDLPCKSHHDTAVLPRDDAVGRVLCYRFGYVRLKDL